MEIQKRTLIISGAVVVLILVAIAFWIGTEKRKQAIFSQRTATTVSSGSDQLIPSQAAIATVLSPVEEKMLTATSTIGRDEELTRYWLSRVNEIRRQKNLSELRLDPRLSKTATDWAQYLGSHAELTHDRPDGKTVHQWVEPYALPFTDRNSEGGWKGNFFTENIGRAYADENVSSSHAALDQVFADMQNETPDGPHVRTFYSTDWNSFGAGFFSEPVSPGRVRLYMVFHYASLKLE